MNFEQWWERYRNNLHASRAAAGLHPVSLSTLVCMEAAARVAWEQGREVGYADGSSDAEYTASVNASL